MDDRIQQELVLLQNFYKKVSYVEDGRWILIEDYLIPADLLWNRKKTNICFQVHIAYPGTSPYGFYVPSGILCDEKRPSNYQEPANNKPPFLPEIWGIFSWSQQSGWQAKGNPYVGSNLLNFTRTFTDRFCEGI